MLETHAAMEYAWEAAQKAKAAQQTIAYCKNLGKEFWPMNSGAVSGVEFICK
jgi:roadblock/LC7 domain-containing protein